MSIFHITDTPDWGQLKINLTSRIHAHPIENARISISYTGVPDETLEELTTDSSGQTDTINLPAPPIEYSLDETNELQPYSEYTISVEAAGYESIQIAGAEILSTVTAIQNISMRPLIPDTNQNSIYVIPAHTLYGNYPAKIPEEEIKPLTESGEIVLSRSLFPNTSLFMMEVRETPPLKIIMSVTKITSKMWHPVKSMQPGPPIRFAQMYWQLCPLH